MDLTTTTFIGAIAASLGSIITALFTKKKTNADVDSIQLDNLTKKLEFYDKLIKNYQEQLLIYIKQLDETRTQFDKTRTQLEETRTEVFKLRKVVTKMIQDYAPDKDIDDIINKIDEV